MLAPHQTDAVRRARELLDTKRGLILADDAGLGKSFIAAELMRGRETVDLIVPAALVPQWRETLASFGVQARIVTHDGLATDPYLAEPYERLVVVDEAHAFRNPATRRYAALARRTAGARVLLITATPVCNSAADLEALLRIVARDDLLAGAGIPSIDVAFGSRDAGAIATIVTELVIRRDRSVLPEELQFGELERRVIRHPMLDARAIEELQFPLVIPPETPGAGTILRRFLWRRLESSEAALIESLRRQLRFYDRALTAIASGRTLPKREYRRAFGHEEDRDAFQEVLFWDFFAPPGESDPRAILEERERLQRLLALAQQSPPEKRQMLLDLIRGTCEPVLIFTSAAATAADLHEAVSGLRRCGLVTSRVRSREAVLRAFREGLLDVVVSTDMAAEGLNLQRAGVVVHYDIPWNPVKLDQRNGRAHRIGQRRERVQAIYFLPRTRETKIVETVARKNRIRRQTLRTADATRGDAPPTLRPRVARDAAVLPLARQLPESLWRRHKAGIELLMRELSREGLSRGALDDLVALVECELAGTTGRGNPAAGNSARLECGS